MIGSCLFFTENCLSAPNHSNHKLQVCLRKCIINVFVVFLVMALLKSEIRWQVADC